MLVRTSAQDLVKSGIHANCVDTGWVTNEAPERIAQLMRERGFVNPLDCEDGAARVLDPIYSGLLQGCHKHGLFFKDYCELQHLLLERGPLCKYIIVKLDCRISQLCRRMQI